MEYPTNKRKVYCQLREIDKNFRRYYNERQRTEPLPEEDDETVVVIGDWYRRALGIPGTGNSVELTIKKANILILDSIRACCHHPEPVVRLATRLGVWSVFLGVAGLAFGFGVQTTFPRLSLAAILVISLLIFGSTRGIKK